MKLMKKRSILIFPKFKNIEEIEKLRKKYDPLVNCIAPHITLVFPFISEISTSELKEHLKSKLRGIDPFKIKLHEITGTVDRFLFLNVKEGNDKLIELHDKLYTNILEKYKDNAYTYIPHVTIGRLKNENEFKQALLETKDFDFIFTSTVNEIAVEIIDDQDNSIIEFTTLLNQEK
jgi:2'-5' RNA ligase